MSVPAQKRAIKWHLGVRDVRLKLDLAHHHFNIPYPAWLRKVEERLHRAESLGIHSPTLLTLKRAQEYETFLDDLFKACNEQFNPCLTETLFEDELDCLRRELYPEPKIDAGFIRRLIANHCIGTVDYQAPEFT